jgi:hypothetical protein
LISSRSSGRLISALVHGKWRELEGWAGDSAVRAVSRRRSCSEDSAKRQFDIASDGRFVLNVPVEPVSDQSFNVLVNWPAGLIR